MHDFQPLTIVGVRRETADAISVTLAVPDGLAETYHYQPGQHLAIRAEIGGEDVRRTYSICSGPGDAYLRIAIKRIPGGVFSSWANETLVAGQVLEAMPPSGRFVLLPSGGQPRHIVAFAAGAGITPIMGIIKHALLREPATEVSLFYGNRDVETILFREELEDLKDAHMDRFVLGHVLTRGATGQSPLFTGRIDGDKVRVLTRTLLRPERVSHVFLCGPGSMIKNARDALLGEGIPRDRIHHEFFAPGGGVYQRRPETAAPTAPQIDTAEAVATLDGVRYTFLVPSGERIIDAALKAGVRLPYSCKGGMCCTCRCRLREGQVTMDINYSLEPWELEAGYVLACQSRPTTGRVAIDFDAT